MQAILLRYDLTRLRLRVWRERLERFIVWKLPPRLIMWAYCRATGPACARTSPDEVTVADGLKAWMDAHEIR
jgi:hypothetical protein